MTTPGIDNSTNFSIDCLLQNGEFPHEVTKLELHETHISWVVLTGPFAYKIKKPVSFDFVDYRTLDRRKTFCHKEVELNRRFAPELYLGVVPIFEETGRLKVGDAANRQVPETPAESTSKQPVEYAVKMRQFPQNEIAAAMLVDKTLTADLVEQLGMDVAAFHDLIECAAPTTANINVEQILADAIGNFPILTEAFRNDRRNALIRKLEHWTVEQFERLRPDFLQRFLEGKVRQCHGDLHLKNIVRWNGRLMPFDGIEFNEEFQRIDVLSEIAFPVMDLVARRRTDHSWRMLNAYLESTGDYAGLSVLRFYLVYRALVRAKITWLNPKNKTAGMRKPSAINPPNANVQSGPWDKYLIAANYFAFEVKPALSITHGFSGSGKSTVAMQIIDQRGGIRIRTDVERQRLAVGHSANYKYSPEMNKRVYEYLLELADTAIVSGLPVIVDGTFLKRKRREAFERLAAERNVPYSIIDCHATFDELCRRISNRVGDPSEATIDVLKLQLKSHDPLTTKERGFVIQPADPQ